MHQHPIGLAQRVPLPQCHRWDNPCRWRSCAAAIGLFIATGCSYDATLQRETATGGLVTFSIQSDSDVLSSDGRRAALRLMHDKCPSGIHILNEGEVPKVSRAADRAWGPQIGTNRIWGIHFACK